MRPTEAQWSKGDDPRQVAWASAVAALRMPLGATVWAEFDENDELHIYVQPHDVRAYLNASEAFWVDLATVRQRLAALDDAGTVDRFFKTPRRCRSHAPPGQLVTASPNRPNGPPRCAAMNLAGTAAA